jgi:hypothetical protein
MLALFFYSGLKKFTGGSRSFGMQQDVQNSITCEFRLNTSGILWNFFAWLTGIRKSIPKKLGTTDDKRFAEFLAVIVDLQEILGDIHDCDVVLEVLTDYGTQSGHETVASGVAKLIAQTKKTRNADYKTFLEKWEYLSEIDFKQKLLSFLAS